MTVVTGLIDTEDPVAQEKVVDMSEKIHRLQPDRTQFITALMKFGRKEAVAEIIDWLEEELRPRVSSMAASATSAATAATVTTGEGNTVFAVNDVVRNCETGEGWLVTSVSANSIGITRSWGGTAAASSTSAAQLLIVGNAYAQGASSGTARYQKRVRAYNYVQEIRDSLWFSTIQAGRELYGGRDPGKELVRKATEHKRSLESTLFWGVRDYDSSGPRGSCGGAAEFISTNITNASGSLTPAEFDTFLEGPLAKGTDQKAFFCAPRVASALSQMLRGVWHPATVGEEKFGAKVSAYLDSAYGLSIPVFVKKEWSDFAATGTNYGTWGFLIDLGLTRIRPYRDVGIASLRRNIQEPSSTAVVHEYYTAMSLEFGQEKAHGILKGVTSYAAS